MHPKDYSLRKDCEWLTYMPLYSTIYVGRYVYDHVASLRVSNLSTALKRLVKKVDI